MPDIGRAGAHDRRDLGPADVPDDELAAMVAALWGVPAVELLGSATSPVAYDVPSITTASRTWVTGTADAGAGPREFRLFVKHVHRFDRSPFFATVPPEVRTFATIALPWEAEALVYRSDLAARLPDGLGMPRCLAVHDLDEGSRSIWLEALDPVPGPWSDAEYAEAARLLGRLSGSPEVAGLAALDPHVWHVDLMVAGRLKHGVIPPLLDDDLWRHPALAGTYGPVLRDRLLDAAARVDDVAAEFAALPTAASHGDACPGNLLRVPGRDGLVLIDFQFWRPQPLGHDLGQLLAGDLQLGTRPALTTEEVADLDELILRAYLDGLAEEGADADPHVVRRGHAVSMMLFVALPSVPVELLESVPADRLAALATARAALATYCCDLLDATAS
ncbi:phosphotransferase [Nocardioides sediminis]|uniref:phosphotransferase n=1 Tax=Nocardioides sediminis TaxID=433648 RepID=UPI000D31C4AD|nr:phosphotransferase [Nocardioides sediminis]